MVKILFFLQKFIPPEGQPFPKECCLFPSEDTGFPEGNYFSSGALCFLKEILQCPELLLALYPLLPSGTLLLPSGDFYFSLRTSHFVQEIFTFLQEISLTSFRTSEK
ncbi:hypothetical protein CEE35_03450 [Candidatus Aerophobetes bacterium Ae_b3b]|nr:MAG: hypothetical protein CEE35_03450 [Candidatus Aerophobetes bacterium Ae_b3b]